MKNSLIGKWISGPNGENKGIVASETKTMITIINAKRVRKDIVRSEFKWFVEHGYIVIHDQEPK